MLSSAGCTARDLARGGGGGAARRRPWAAAARRWAPGRAPAGRPSWRRALLGALASTVVTLAVTLLLRAALQVRTVPERVMEWLLLFVPLDLFEAGIRRFGFDAKRYALAAAFLAMAVALTALGALALRRRWPAGRLVGLGLGLWLFVMLVVMPLTSAGPFAVALVNGTTAAVGGYLVAALVYAGVLALFRGGPAPPGRAGRAGGAWLDPATAGPAGVGPAGLGAPARRGRGRARGDRPRPALRPPPAPARGGRARPPGADPLRRPGRPRRPPRRRRHPGARARAGARGRSAAPAGVLDPPAPRQLARDKDGAALASGRRPGQLAEPITSNADFYIVTKNAGGTRCWTAAEWRLRIDGEVGRPVELDLASLRRLPALEVTKTLECISNFVAKCELAPFGCDLISTARWKGVRVSDVLALAGGARPGPSPWPPSPPTSSPPPCPSRWSWPRTRCWCTR